MSNEPTVVYSARMPAQANLVRNLLAQNGIEAYIVNESLQGVRGAVGFGESTEAKVVVSAAQAEAALRLAREFERLDAESALSSVDENDFKSQVAPLELSPPCPRCGAARAIVCPYCETRGTEFRPGDDVDGETHLVVCPTCDEPFAPRYVRFCQACGHDFGSGVDEDETELLTPRAVAVILGLAATGVAMLTYFFLLLDGR